MKSIYISFGTVIILGVISVFWFPNYAISPGRLIHGHEKLKDNCFACHSIFSGASTEKCTQCHSFSEDITNTSKGNSLPFKSGRSVFIHQSVKNTECYKCHVEHKGISALFIEQNFSHDLLPSSIQKECRKCHATDKPDDKIHSIRNDDCFYCHTTEQWDSARFNHDIQGNDISHCGICHDKQKPKDSLHSKELFPCLKCHDTNTWKGVTFDHALPGELTYKCIDCHLTNIPSDDLHRFLPESGSCSGCHNTSGWKPSSFDHSKYFRFDDNHPSTCTNCHAAGSYFHSYTCYNCHEHSRAKISEEHREEGISSFDNCVQCHRSGNEHESGERERKREHKHKKEHDSEEDD